MDYFSCFGGVICYTLTFSPVVNHGNSLMNNHSKFIYIYIYMYFFSYDDYELHGNGCQNQGYLFVGLDSYKIKV